LALIFLLSLFFDFACASWQCLFKNDGVDISPCCLENASFMPRISAYGSLLLLAGIYSSWLDSLNKEEIVFFFLLNCFHIFFGGKIDSDTKKVFPFLLLNNFGVLTSVVICLLPFCQKDKDSHRPGKGSEPNIHAGKTMTVCPK
jgi:hypothetical protein